MITIQLLGTPLVFADGKQLTVPRRKSRALLFYLAAQGAPVSRDQILALLWPDLDRAAAQQTLRTTLHGLRRAIGTALWAEDTLSLAPDTEVDTQTFARAVNAASIEAEPLASALALYRGEFLAGFGVPDAEAFEEWADVERERFRQLALRGYAALAQRYEARQEYGAALDALARALAHDPLQEDLQRSAMRLHYLSGDRAGAIRRYEQLRRLLDDELGVPPLEETRELYDQIIKDAVPASNAASASGQAISLPPIQRAQPVAGRAPLGQLPFIGRTDELRRLDEIMRAGKLALIEGEPGIGKTRLADAFLAQFAGLTLMGTARELEQALPYQPVIEALRGLLAHQDWPHLREQIDLAPVWQAELARLLPEIANGFGRDNAEVPLPAALRTMEESRLWEGVHQLLLSLARRGPVAFLIDDAHWADASSLALLAYLVRQPALSAASPVLFLATARPPQPRTPLAALIQTLTREDRIGRIALRRFSEAETVALAQHLSPVYAYPLAEWLSRNAEGNPYILAELVRYARADGLLQQDAVVNLAALSAAPVVPGAIYSLIQSRLERLSDTARRVLDVAVAVGREFELDLVARAASVSETQALDALEELQRLGLVAPGEGLQFAFDHTLTMEVAWRETGEPRHRLAHRQVAEALEQQHANDLDAVAGLIASHFAEGGAPERAADYAFRAGQRAARLSAWAEAIAFFEQALLGAANGWRAAIYRALSQSYMQSGSPVQASEAAQAALHIALQAEDVAEINQARLMLARSLLSQARFGESINQARLVLATGREEDRVAAEVAWGTALSIEGVDLAGAAEHLGSAQSLCATQSDPGLLAQTTFELGSVAAQRGDLPGAIALYRRALQVAETYPVAALYQVLALNNLAYHLLLLGDPSAREYGERGLALVRELGIVGFEPFLLSTLGEISLADGDVDAAERWFTEGLELAERLNIPERIAGLTANLGLVAVRREQTALAIHRLSTALTRADSLNLHHHAAQFRIWLAPLLPPAERRAVLAEARAMAESDGRAFLLEQIKNLEK